MQRITETLLAAVVVCSLLAPGVVSAAAPTSGAPADATGEEQPSSFAESVQFPDNESDNETTELTDTADAVDETTATVENTIDSTAETNGTVDETTDAVDDDAKETADTIGNTTGDTDEGDRGSLNVYVDGDVHLLDGDMSNEQAPETVESTVSNITVVTAVGPDGGRLTADASVARVIDGEVSADVSSDSGPSEPVGETDEGDVGTSDAESPTSGENGDQAQAFTPLGTPPLPGGGPVGSGTAAFGGALALGLGYAGRRAVAGASAAPAPATTVTQARLFASLLADAVRARELPDWVRWLPVVGGYSRYDSSDPLEHENRAAIVDRLEAEPGTYLSAVADETGIPLPTVRYHMKILRHEERVTSEVIRGKRRYFPAGFEATELAAALDDAATRDVLHALEAEEPATVTDLADVLNRDPSTVTHHCKRLEEDGLVERERDGRAVLTSLSPEARDALRTVPPAETGETPIPADD
ncbi:helix-turn-helix domain-containing protein [Halostella sp. PRR32]|uniref:winged helix-turn-helix transcriptional regulator n=2 Tax=Halobacteriales TaxID=2235 RepID=UPI002B1D05B9|nr:helix-turn-helix domain-containing protein [Halostella sp. PRR32]